MIREDWTIKELEQYIAHEWRPVYAAFGEDSCCRPTKFVQIDLICEWRLTDGKWRFVEVPFNTDEEMIQIKTLLDNSVEELAKAVREHFSEITPEEFHEAMDAATDHEED